MDDIATATTTALTTSMMTKKDFSEMGFIMGGNPGSLSFDDKNGGKKEDEDDKDCAQKLKMAAGLFAGLMPEDNLSHHRHGRELQQQQQQQQRHRGNENLVMEKRIYELLVLTLNYFGNFISNLNL